MDDLISRQAAINAIDGLYLDGESAQGFTADANGDCLIGKYKAIEILEELPSVQPTQRTGKWIEKPSGRYGAWQSWCSVCGNHSGIGGIESNRHKPYCPNCGAKMEEGE